MAGMKYLRGGGLVESLDSGSCRASWIVVHLPLRLPTQEQQQPILLYSVVSIEI
jgi:hypothetical protein